jgi:hypothetical protein
MGENKVQLNCRHSFTPDCVEQYLDAHINIHEAQNMRCLQEGCHHIITIHEVSRFGDIDQLTKYNKCI